MWFAIVVAAPPRLERRTSMTRRFELDELRPFGACTRRCNSFLATRCLADSIDDSLIAGAAAEVAGKALSDFVITGVGIVA